MLEPACSHTSRACHVFDKIGRSTLCIEAKKTINSRKEHNVWPTIGGGVRHRVSYIGIEHVDP